MEREKNSVLKNELNHFVVFSSLIILQTKIPHRKRCRGCSDGLDAGDLHDKSKVNIYIYI